MLALARLFCVFVLIDTHLLVLSFIDVCGEDEGKLLQVVRLRIKQRGRQPFKTTANLV